MRSKLKLHTNTDITFSNKLKYKIHIKTERHFYFILFILNPYFIFHVAIVLSVLTALLLNIDIIDPT